MKASVLTLASLFVLAAAIAVAGSFFMTAPDIRSVQAVDPTPRD